MVNQQLVEYFKSQIKLGVGKDAIGAALEKAGWPKEDIDDSSRAAEVVQAPVVAQTAPSTISVSDLIPASKLESVRTIDKPGKNNLNKEQAAKKNNIGIRLPKLNTSFVAIIVLAVIALGFAGGAAFLYIQNRGLQEKVSTLGGTSDATNQKIASLNSQITDTAKASDNLKAQIVSLMETNKELAANLSFFVAPSGPTPAQDTAIDVKGTLGGSAKTFYTLTLPNGIKLNIKNSKDSKVDVALKPLIGSSVEILGTYVPGSRDVTVKGVNGAAL